MTFRILCRHQSEPDWHPLTDRAEPEYALAQADMRHERRAGAERWCLELKRENPEYEFRVVADV